MFEYLLHGSNRELNVKESESKNPNKGTNILTRQRGWDPEHKWKAGFVEKGHLFPDTEEEGN